MMNDTENEKNEKIIIIIITVKRRTYSIKSLTFLPSLQLHAASSTPGTLSANFKVLKASEYESTSGFSCINMMVFA